MSHVRLLFSEWSRRGRERHRWASREAAVSGSARVKHNLEKSDKILMIAPWIFAGVAAAHTFSDTLWVS
jgi:hypothetical protein